MDINRLRPGEQIAAVAAIVLLLDMFLFKWFGLKVSAATPLGGISAEGSKNAWGSMDLIRWILLITVIAALGMAYLRASDTEIDLPVAASVVVAVLGGLSTLLILIRLISPPDFGAPDAEGIDTTRKIGAFIGLIAAAVLTYGGYRAMQDEGTSFQGAADRFGGGGDVGGGPGDVGGGPGEPPSVPPPPPPPPSSGAPPAV
jgi:hypothetical protein